MVFSSFEFIFRFLPIFLLIYYITPKYFRNLVLLIGSIIFYTLGEPLYILLLLASVAVNFAAAIKMDGQQEQGTRRFWLIMGLTYNFGMLFFFKYSNFAIENLNLLLGRVFPGFGGIGQVQTALPLGISFYTFQIASYLADVYWRKLRARSSVISLATYLIMFPQLLSGPLVPLRNLTAQLRKREYSLAQFENGLRIFIMGLSFKVLLANKLSGLWNQIQTIGFESISTPMAWLGAVTFSMQLYFDFNGYSLMAVGVGKMLGFHLPENFKHPYMSRSIAEFYRRWHITLGVWFRDYIYIPLGGSRVGSARIFRNLLVVWAFTGLWHGASWNFVLWGLVLFLFIFLEKTVYGKWLEKLPAAGHLYVLFIIPVTWVIFAITDFSQLLTYLGRMFPWIGGSQGLYVNPTDYLKYGKMYAVFLAAGILFCMPFPEKLLDKYKESFVGGAVFLLLFWLSIYELSVGVNNPFMYFRF